MTVTNVDDPGSAVVTGTARAGQTLTAAVSDPDGTASALVYEWQRADTRDGTYAAISGATGTTYDLTSSDVGKFIRVEVSYTAGGFTGSTATSTPTAAITANTAPVVGTVIPDQVLTAGDDFTLPANSFTDADGDTLDYSITWDDPATTTKTFVAAPDWLVIDPATGTITLGEADTIDPVTKTVTEAGAEAVTGKYTIGITASDGTDSISDDFELSVLPEVEGEVIWSTADTSWRRIKRMTRTVLKRFR